MPAFKSFSRFFTSLLKIKFLFLALLLMTFSWSANSVAQSFSATGNNNGTVTFTWSNPNPVGKIWERVGSPSATANVIETAHPGSNLSRTISRSAGTYYYFMESCTVDSRGVQNCIYKSSTVPVTIQNTSPPATATANFKAASVNESGNVIFEWSSAYTSQCSSNDIAGVSATSGAVTYYAPTVMSQNQTKTITITCTGAGGSATASKSIPVNWINDLPVFSASSSVSATEDNVFYIPFTLSDEETPNASISWSISSTDQTKIANGDISVELANNRLRVTPKNDANGNVTISLRVTDAHGGFADRSVAVSITPVNDAPVIGNVSSQSFNEGETGSRSISVSVSDIDTPLASLSLSGSSNNSEVVSSVSTTGSGNLRTLNYSLTGKPGTARVTLTLSDGSASVSKDVTITVVDLPAKLSVDNDDGAGNFTLSWRYGNQSTSLSESGPNGTRFIGDFGVSGSRTFSQTVAGTYIYSLSDCSYNTSNGQPSCTQTDTKTINVTSLPATATANFKAASVNESGSVIFEWSSTNTSQCTSNDIAGVSATSGAVTYYAPSVMSQNQTKTITVTCTGVGGSASASKSIPVNWINDDPVFTVSSSVNAVEDTVFYIPFSLSDEETPNASIVWSISSGDQSKIANSDVVPELANNRLRVTPKSNAHGNVIISLRVADAHNGYVDRSVNVAIAPVNDAPVIGNVPAQSFNEGDTGARSITVDVSDIDTPINALSLSGSSNNTDVVSSVSTTGSADQRTLNISLTGKPGTARVTLTLNDGGASESKDVTITVVDLPAKLSVDSDDGAGNFTLSWRYGNQSTQLSESGPSGSRFVGDFGVSGSRAFSQTVAGTYIYSLSDCSYNPMNGQQSCTQTDTKTIVVNIPVASSSISSSSVATISSSRSSSSIATVSSSRSSSSISTVSSSISSSSIAISSSAISSSSANSFSSTSLSSSSSNAATRRYEAEAATHLSGVAIMQETADFSGTGYGDYNTAQGSFIEWTVSQDIASHVQIIVRYSNGNPPIRPMDLFVNGVKVGARNFATTSAWTKWSTEVFSASLVAGENKIKLVAATTAAGSNIDYIEISETSSSSSSSSSSTISSSSANSFSSTSLSSSSSNAATRRYEAEAATYLSGVVILRENAGYSGTGYGDYNTAMGSYIEWTISQSTAGQAQIIVRYSNGNPPIRPMDLFVNGIKVGTKDFATTKGWTKWSTEAFSASLLAGENTIRLVAATTAAGSNIDYIEISETNSPTSPPIDLIATGSTFLQSVKSDAVIDPLNDVISEDVYRGALSGIQNVGADGSFNYSLPLNIPAGIGGMQPKLQLSYNSNAKNGLLGWGWALSGLSVISRCNANIVRDGYVSGINNDNAYKFCLDGQRLIEVSSNTYRTESESFLQIQKAGDYWLVTDNSGTQSRFGFNLDSRQKDAEGSSRTWYLDQRKDVVGNYWSVTYLQNDIKGTNHPSRIDYTSTTLTSAHHSVHFAYENRDDIQKGFQAGGSVIADQRLASIEVKSGNSRVMKYALNYQQQGVTYNGKLNDDPTKTSRLANIKLCYSTDSDCAKTLDFDWSFNRAQDYRYVANTASHQNKWHNFYAEQYSPQAGYWRMPEGTTIDIDKDGYPDVYFHPIPAAFTPKIPIEHVSNRNRQYHLGGGRYEYYVDKMTSYPAQLSIEPRDVNNDGYTDIVVNAPETLGVEVYLNVDIGGVRRISANKSAQFSIDKTQVSFIATQEKQVIDTYYSENSVYRVIRGEFGYKVNLVDMNGDGLLDVVRHPTGYQTTDLAINHGWRFTDSNCTDPIYKCTWSDGGRTDVSVAFNTGNGFTNFTTLFDFVTQPGFWFQKSAGSFADVNGDGLVDFLAGWIAPLSNAGTSKSAYVYLNNGKGQNGGALTAVTWGHTYGNINDVFQLLGDFNGDGQIDSVTLPKQRHPEFQDPLPPQKTVSIKLNKGNVSGGASASGSLFTDTLTLPIELPITCTTQVPVSNNCGLLAVDVNGDGRTDIVEMPKASSGVRSDYPTITPAGIYDAQYSAHKPATTGYARVFLSKGSPNELGVEFSAGIEMFSPDLVNSLVGDTNLRWMTTRDVFTDTNQDGMPENSYLLVSAIKPQHITRVTTEAGAVQVDYESIQPARPHQKTTIQQGIANTDSPDYNFTLKPSGRQWVVNTLTNDNGAGSQNISEYEYFEQKMHTAGYGNLGFGRMVKTDTAYGVAPVVTTTDFYQEANSQFVLVGKTKRQQVKSGSQLLSDTRYQWKVRRYSDDVDFNFTSPHYFAYLYESSTQQWDLDGTKIADSRTQQGAYRSPSCDPLGESSAVLTTSSGSAEDVDYNADGVLLYSQTATCDQSGSSASVQIKAVENLDITSKGDARGLVQKSKQYAWTGTSVSSASKSFYDVRTQAFTYNALGQLESKTIEPEAASPNTLKLTTSYLYNGFGSVRQVTDAWEDSANDGLEVTTRVTTIDETYTNGIRKLVVTKPLNISETTQFHPVWGAPTKQIDANGIETNTLYDNQGRPERISYADGTSTQLDYRRCNGCSPYHSNAVWYKQIKTTGSSAVRMYYDGFNREIGSRSKGLTGREAYTIQTYDSRGAPFQSTAPFYYGEAQKTVTTHYDALGRVSSVNHPDGSSESRGYYGLRHTTTNRLNQTQTRYLNAAGWVMRSVDNAGTPVDFTYWAWGDLKTTQVNNDPKTLVSVVYDKLGRKTEMTDPNTGKTTYTYNALDLVATQTDAKNQRTCFGYDALGRQTKRVDNASSSCSGTTQSWVYDTKTKGKGQLGSMSGTNTDGTSYSEQYSYTHYGLPESTTSSFDGSSYTTKQHYDSFNRPLGVTYPTGYVAANGYNSYGHLEQVKDSTGKTLWAANDADALGNIKQFTLGNGAVTTQTYNANTGRIESIRAVSGSLVIQDQYYNFDELGNLRSREDRKNSITQSFCYDGLNRLKAARFNGCSSAANDYNYDPLGNLTTKEGLAGTLGYGTSGSNVAGPHAVTSANGWSYKYDTIGNLESATKAGEQTKTVSYSPFNTPTSITQGSKFSTLVYGPNQDRIKHSDSNGRITKYVGGIYEEVTKGDVTQKIHYVGDFALLISQGENTSATYKHEYLHRDHIGSIVAISKGTIETVADVSWQANGAWGERRFNQWNGPLDNLLIPTSTARGFTDHEHLDAVGLIHMNGRVYDPELGRFMSADPFVQAPYNSQSYNRYSYVFNNPLSFTDPSGYLTSDYCPGNNTAVCKKDKKKDEENEEPAPEELLVEGNQEQHLRRMSAVDQSNIAGWRATEDHGEKWAYTNGAAYNVNSYWGVMLYSLAAGGYGASGSNNGSDFSYDNWLSQQNFMQINPWDGAVWAEGYNNDEQMKTVSLSIASVFPVGRAAGVTFSLGGRLISMFGLLKGANKLCFVEGTLVHTQDGLKPIEEIQVGDLVASKDEFTGETTWKPVVDLFRNYDKSTLNVTLVNPEGEEELLGVTAEHPFWVEGQGWVDAGKLREGHIISSVDGDALTVNSIVPDEQLHDTYNFEVADYHTYFVGEQGAWVHNQCRGLWRISKEGTERVAEHGKFGKFYKSKSDGLWWSKDNAGHGGSAWKVFKESKSGLEWHRDADKFGNFIVGKHKGDTGMSIPWKQLSGSSF